MQHSIKMKQTSEHLSAFVSSGNLEQFLSFEPTDMPKWREKNLSPQTVSSIPTTSDMIREIAGYQRTYDKLKKSNNNNFKRQEVQKKLLTQLLCVTQTAEGIGVQNEGKTKQIMQRADTETQYSYGSSQNFSKAETETMNLCRAHYHIIRETQPDTGIDFFAECGGLLETDSLILRTHEILMEDVMKEHQIPGRFSTKQRETEFRGKKKYYPAFEQERFAHKAIETLVDKTNDIFDQIKNKLVSEEEKLKLFFKCTSLFMYCFLTIHPFPDGNGRLARLLASYHLTTISPFDTPIFNVFGVSGEDDFIRALADTSENFLSSKRMITTEDEAVKLAISVLHHKPSDLCAMVIESNWAMWRQLLFALGDDNITPFEWDNQQFFST